MTETVELKNCPFCSNALSIIRDRDGDPLYAHPDSETCVLSGTSWDEDCFDVTAWNTRALSVSRPAVKGLEWEDLGDGKAFRAYLPFIGSVRVEPYGVCGWWEVLWSMPGQCDKLIPDVFDTPDEAKAAAQADYAQRILSALEARTSPPEPAQEGEPVAWRYSSGSGKEQWLVTTDQDLAYREHEQRNLVEPLYAATRPASGAKGPLVEAHAVKMRKALEGLVACWDDFRASGADYESAYNKLDEKWDAARAALTRSPE